MNYYRRGKLDSREWPEAEICKPFPSRYELFEAAFVRFLCWVVVALLILVAFTGPARASTAISNSFGPVTFTGTSCIALVDALNGKLGGGNYAYTSCVPTGPLQVGAVQVYYQYKPTGETAGADTLQITDLDASGGTADPVCAPPKLLNQSTHQCVDQSVSLLGPIGDMTTDQGQEIALAACVAWAVAWTFRILARSIPTGSSQDENDV